MEFETLKDKKENSLRKLDVAIEMSREIQPNLYKFVVWQLVIENMQMLITSCECSREFLLKQLKVKPAFKIDLNVIVNLTISNLKEGVSLLMYNLGLIIMQIAENNKLEVHDLLFYLLYPLNKNLEILLVCSKQYNVKVSLV